jgi:hypothetical protein
MLYDVCEMASVVKTSLCLKTICNYKKQTRLCSDSPLSSVLNIICKINFYFLRLWFDNFLPDIRKLLPSSSVMLKFVSDMCWPANLKTKYNSETRDAYKFIVELLLWIPLLGEFPRSTIHLKYDVNIQDVGTECWLSVVNWLLIWKRDIATRIDT